MQTFFSKTKLLVLLLTLIAAQSSAQHDEKILESANAWANAQNNDDFETLADYTSPRLLAYSGGRDKWINNRRKQLKEFLEWRIQ